MRPLQLADLEVALRAVIACEKEERPRLVARLIADAETADEYRLVIGQAHPQLGPGTLMGAAFRHTLAPRPACMDPSTLDALSLLITALRSHHTA